MDILGIGFSELLFIFIIALMVFGPRRLPEIAGKAGRIVRDLRNMSQGFLAEWQREITVATRLEELEEVRKELEDTKQSLRQSQAEIATGAAQVSQSINTIASPNRSNPTAVPAKPAEPTPQTSETTIEPEPGPTPPLPPETVTPATETPLTKEADSDSTVAPPSAHVSAEAAEITSETAPIENNGNGMAAVTKPMPSAVTPGEAAE